MFVCLLVERGVDREDEREREKRMALWKQSARRDGCSQSISENIVVVVFSCVYRKCLNMTAATAVPMVSCAVMAREDRWFGVRFTKGLMTRWNR